MAQQTAVLCLIDYKPKSLTWGLLRFVIGRFDLRHIPGLQFYKILGSGFQGGFDVRPSFHKQGLFCLFDSLANAQEFLNHSPLIKDYQKHAREFFTVTLQAYSSKGSWAGNAISVCATEPANSPIAAITRASIHPLRAKAFWSKAPPAELELQNSPGCLLAAGLGEAPYFRQATFTIWESAQHMDQYARQGAHLEAIRSALQGQYFSESMFTRFKPMNPQGTWRGQCFG
ncbi:MAG: spheroidene monooxygenase [Polynucleobacter sp.]|jgi:spheroidene monooxygenase|nr:spheroidene monooxygenase [Polynucleobacter sp.]